MEEMVFEMLKSKNRITETDNSIAMNAIEVCDNEVVIKGNKIGLILLAEYIVQVAISDVRGKHFHLDESNFFDKANCELIISKEKIQG